MIFYVRSMSTLMGGSGLIGFLQILKGLKRKAQDYEQFWELADRLSETC